MRQIVSRITRNSVALTAVVCIAGALTLTACGPTPCADAIRNWADTPVRNITRVQAERTVFCLTNAHRAANGRTAFTSSDLLARTARAHANDAVAQKWWVGGADTHRSPNGKFPADRIRDAGYCPSGTWSVAENTYWGWGGNGPTPRDAVNWWKGSPGHNANLLSPNLRELGVGVALGAAAPPTPSEPYTNAAVFVQNFGSCT